MLFIKVHHLTRFIFSLDIKKILKIKNMQLELFWEQQKCKLFEKSKQSVDTGNSFRTR